jgi:NAD(P)-dependent dehydrogenase (short-subunit alcohol dehydrogenase family)
MSKKVEGKIALITGGSAGIGVATAKRFVKEDAFVYIAGRRKHQLADAVASIGSEITAIQGDVAKIADLGHIYAQIGQEKGGVDIVFANSDISPVARLGSITEEQFDPTFNMNVKGLLFTAQKALPLMPDDPHPATLEHGPAVDRSISVDARTDLEGFPPSSGRAGRGLRTTVALGVVIVAAGLGLWAYDDFTATPVRPAVVRRPASRWRRRCRRTSPTGPISPVSSPR